jgi:nucleoid DNA-binding protein
MNKKDLIDGVSVTAQISKTDAKVAVEAVLDTLSAQLVKGDSVSIAGFGTFEVRARAARAGRNPQTGAEIQIKASKGVRFKAAKALKEAVQ